MNNSLTFSVGIFSLLQYILCLCISETAAVLVKKYKLTGKVKAVLQEDGFSTLFSKLVANGIVSEEVVVACRSVHFLARVNLN